MGDYISSQQIEDRIGTKRLAELTASSGDSPNAANVTAEIEGAEGVVNSYLAARFGTPIDLALFPDSTDVLYAKTADILTYRLHWRTEVVPEAVAEAYKAAIAWLEKIAEGVLPLPSDPPPTSQTADISVSVSSDTPVTGRANMGGL